MLIEHFYILRVDKIGNIFPFVVILSSDYTDDTIGYINQVGVFGGQRLIDFFITFPIHRAEIFISNLDIF